MSSWITNGLKSLRVRVGGAVGSVSQPRYYGAQAKEINVPPKPKKPLTPYFRFLGQVRSEVQKENPSVKVTELMKLVAQKWDRLDDPSKQSYIDAYKGEMESYSPILDKYNKSLTPQQKEFQQQMKFERQLLRERRDKKKRLKELGKPKKPASPFLLYLSGKVSPGSGISTYQTAAKELSQTWKSMSEAEKEPFVSKYQQDLQNYEKTMLKWEEKMLKQGNDDLVRESRKPAKTRSKTK